MNERQVSINGIVLSDGQVLTLRMALGALRLDLHENAGDEGVATQTVAQHLKHLDELIELIGDLPT